MKRIPIGFAIILFLFPLIVGSKAVSPQYEIPVPQITYNISGTVISAENGLPKPGVKVWIDACDNDTFFFSVAPQIDTARTDDSGTFALQVTHILPYETGVRINATNGIDTPKGPWRFIFTAQKQETTGTYVSHDCNSHTSVIPTSETYTFKPETLILP